MCIRDRTQYYGLSQWEAADKVERVDFNSDNARVDGALHTLAEGAVWEKIGETRAGIPQMSLSIHVPSIGRYRSLQLIFQASMAKGQDLILLALSLIHISPCGATEKEQFAMKYYFVIREELPHA